ncbi:MAG: hypothetical protein IKZ09_11275 [Clostridia bacterium]|nr:hypothetical protein [Clostridia bacterium]
MKKKSVFLLLACAVILLSVLTFSQRTVPRPETDLEFWICDNVNDFDFSEYQPRFGLMGGREYYGKGYQPSVGENGEQIDPAHCVIYTVTAYPDYASASSHITRITITDPNVRIWGLTVDASSTDIMTVMEQNGFRHSTTDIGLTYKRGKISVRFSRGSITVSADVTNIFGIQF